jgi:hypothetical protein
LEPTTSASGRMVKELKLYPNAVSTPVDMTGMAGGLYYIVFINDAVIYSKKVIKE